MTQLEQRNEKVKFQRIDADVTDSVKEIVAEEEKESFEAVAASLVEVFKNKLGKEMMYIKRPNHLGIYIGEVISYNSNKGYVKFKHTLFYYKKIETINKPNMLLITLTFYL